MVDAVGRVLAARMLRHLAKDAKASGATEDQVVAALVILGIAGEAYYRALAEFRQLCGPG